jgi:glycosyltransferase involved in cell wall biosynthesis
VLDRRVVPDPRRRNLLLRAWRARAATATPLTRDQAALVREGLGLGRRLARLGQPDAAVAVYRAGEAAVRDPAGRLLLTVQRAALELRAGLVPDDLWERVADLLALADRHLDGGDVDTAGSRLQEAYNLAFHRTLHFEDLPSPLAEDPDAFLAPFRASETHRLAEAPSGRSRPAAATLAGRPHRLLVTTFMNWNFVTDIVEDYRATPGVEVRTVDLKEIPDGPWRAQPVDLVKDRLRQATGGPDLSPPPEVREAFDWADTVFVEWGHRALPWVSLLPELSARVVARIHSYEAFTPMPLHTDWSGIDDLVFVSSHIRALVEASVPALSGVRCHTIPNRNLLDTYRRPKLPGAERVLGLVGWNNVTKDPAWALDVLEVLLEHDDRWRLRLVGHGFPTSGLTGPASEYRDALTRRIDALGPAVERPGFTDDVPEALRGIGVILSTSRREGTHEGLIQGAASGSVPVVRNWPYVARWGGPATMYPDAWVVETPTEAAALVLEAAAAGRVGSPSADTAEWARTHYDWSVVRPRLDELLLSPR